MRYLHLLILFTFTSIQIQCKALDSTNSNENTTDYLIYVDANGAPLEAQLDYQISFYKDKSQSAPDLTISLKEFMELHQKSNCDNDKVKKYLDPASFGNALYCNSTHDLRRFGYVKLSSPNETKSITHVQKRFARPEDSLVAISLRF